MPNFKARTAAEKQFELQLRKVATKVGRIVATHTDGAEILSAKGLTKALASYSELLGPWADIVVGKMLKGVEADNLKVWKAVSLSIGKELQTTMAKSAVGGVAKSLHFGQVQLIKSLPLEAGIRAQTLAHEAAIGGRRASEVAAEIARTEEVTASRAMLIARTEIAKANATFTRARAEYVGATHYIWHTAEDGDVRDTHAEMDGKIFRFDTPPYIEGEGEHGPGEFPNCRCYAEPIIGEAD